MIYLAPPHTSHTNTHEHTHSFHPQARETAAKADRDASLDRAYRTSTAKTLGGGGGATMNAGATVATHVAAPNVSVQRIYAHLE